MALTACADLERPKPADEDLTQTEQHVDTALGIDQSDCFPLNNIRGIVMERVAYYGPVDSTATDYRANRKADGSGYTVTLRGWLYYHRSSASEIVANRPVVIYNHGYEPLRGEPCALVREFVGAGYVVFAPLRRGHQADTSRVPMPLVSTGTHIGDFVAGCQQDMYKHGCPVCTAAWPSDLQVPCTTTELEVAYEHEWVDDLADAFRYVANHPSISSGTAAGYMADPRHIAILGHSFGGSLAVIADDELPRVYRGGDLVEPNVFIAVSPAEKSWNATWKRALGDAASAAKHPFYVLQPKNGRSLEPTKTLVGAGVEFSKRCQGAIFGATAWDPTSSKAEYEQAHNNFIATDEEVQEWGPSARNFMSRNPGQFPAE